MNFFKQYSWRIFCGGLTLFYLYLGITSWWLNYCTAFIWSAWIWGPGVWKRVWGE